MYIMCIHIYMYIHVYIYIYIHTYYRNTFLSLIPSLPPVPRVDAEVRDESEGLPTAPA